MKITIRRFLEYTYTWSIGRCVFRFDLCSLMFGVTRINTGPGYVYVLRIANVHLQWRAYR